MPTKALKHLEEARREIEAALDVFRGARKGVPAAVRFAINSIRMATEKPRYMRIRLR